MDELPDIIPLFPLPNAVLFPHVDLPLHIFEPRYREMVADAMAGDRLIGMVLLRGNWRKDYLESPQIFPVGCVGRIEEFVALPDGRSNLLLRGVRSFDVVEELPGKAYRRARVRWRPEERVAAPADAALPTARYIERLRSVVTRLLERAPAPVPDDVWERLPRELSPLVNQLAFALDFGMLEKLALLECDGAGARADRLIEIVEFRLAEHGLPSGRNPGDESWH